jgi:hypothetical protein
VNWPPWSGVVSKQRSCHGMALGPAGSIQEEKRRRAKWHHHKAIAGCAFGRVSRLIPKMAGLKPLP